MKKRRAGNPCQVFVCAVLACVLLAVIVIGAVRKGNRIKVTFFDVGKGDAILIETKRHRVLIDTGYDDTVEVILDYLAEQGIKRLDKLVLTHFDEDHVGGAAGILEAVEVDAILQPDYAADNEQYLEYLEALEEKGLEPAAVGQMLYFAYDGAEFLVLPPGREDGGREDNDFSLVISMTYGNKSFLFAGDSEELRMNELMEQEEIELSHDVLKMPHHGVREVNTEDFLRKVSPRLVIVTCSKKMELDDRIGRTLKEVGADVYLTANGTVSLICDGKTLWVKQE